MANTMNDPFRPAAGFFYSNGPCPAGYYASGSGRSAGCMKGTKPSMASIPGLSTALAAALVASVAPTGNVAAPAVSAQIPATNVAAPSVGATTAKGGIGGPIAGVGIGFIFGGPIGAAIGAGVGFLLGKK